MDFNMEPSMKMGGLIFLGMTFLVLAILRFTRQHRVIREKIKMPLIAVFCLLTIYDIFYILQKPIPPMLEGYYFALLYLGIAIILIQVAIFLFFDVFLIRTKQYQTPALLKEIANVVLFTFAVILIIQDTLKIQVTTVLATSAIITVVLGLALQETLGNLFAGLALHLDPPYHPGDWVQAGDIVGRVVEVTWRSTKLYTVNNDSIIIPNGQLAKEKITNHSFPSGPHAVSVYVPASYHVPPNKVARIVREVLVTINNVTMEPPPDIRVSKYQDFSIEYQIKFWFKDFAIIDPTLAEIRKSLWYHFRRNEIEIPFPIRNVYLHEREEILSIHDRRLKHLADSLKKVYLFAPLDDEELRLIADGLVEMHFAPNELIIREGDTDDNFFIIEEGEVEVFLTSASGKRKAMTTLGEGDFFGEMALLTGERRTASVEAIRDVRVYSLGKHSFKEVLERKPEILDEIGTVLSRRKDQLVDKMAESSGVHSEEAPLNISDEKNRILSRIRNYFGL